ncbi:hypothetical protein [Mycolicibacterium sp. CH28]|uniref:hypothetical protein n=1 Tax=Mycolicibacterium sp. CH28 TaxID=2512237 RepID=UPI00108229D7|nr:hypothetical protein [Mycolicibacterium sp. CH28]
MFEKRRLRRHGERCQATVVHVRQAKKIATNDYRRYDFVVDVHPGGGPATRVEISDTFAVTGLKPGAGDVVAVWWDGSAGRAAFDLDGDPRYDLKALRAQQDQQHQALLDQPPD